MSFLSIPLEARRRIYAYAGLVRSCPIDILHERDLKRRRNPGEECVVHALIGGITISRSNGLDCHCPDLPVSILRVNRQTYEEASSVLYGTNDLMTLGRSADDLQSILLIPQHVLAHVRSLLIRLNCWPCPNGHDLYTCDWQRTKCLACNVAVADADPLLSLHNESGRGVLEAWGRVCTHLAGALSPHRTHLSLIADVDGTKEAEAVVADLRRLPVVKQLDIRLGRHKEPVLRDIANNTVNFMTNQYSHPGTYSFEQLPEEIRMRILEFTELAPATRCPERTVRSSQHSTSAAPARVSRGRGRGGRGRGMPVRGRGGPSIQGQRELQGRSGTVPSERPAYHDRSHIYRDRDASSNYGQPHDEVIIRENRISKGEYDGSTPTLCCRNCTLTALSCCCRDLYAASSAYCTCQLIPTGLFYVSKTLNKDATKIFYSQNAFVFHQSFSLTADFFSSLAPSLLALMQDITIKPMPVRRHNEDISLKSDNAGLADIIKKLTDHVPLKTLSFTFDTAEYWDVGLWSEEWEFMYTAHCNAARDMQALRGAKNFEFRAAIKAWTEPLTRLAQGGEETRFDQLPGDN